MADSDNAFYRVPENGNVPRSGARAPAGVLPVVKVSQLLIHIKRSLQ